MNLIEQLGGYEQLKGYIDGALRGMPDSYCYKFDTVLGRKKLLNMRDVKCILLEYRRQHNIFEAGDAAVNRRGEESRLLKIWRVDVCPADKRMSIADYDADGLAGWSRFHCLRHANPEEIKAGKRL